MQFDKLGNSWFALQVQGNHEKVVGSLLGLKGYEQLAPMYKVSRRWSDRIKTLEKPLFPGYVFCRYDPTIGSDVVTTPGVMRVLGARGYALPVSDAEIAAIQAMINSDIAAEPCAYPAADFSISERVRIAAGPFSGLEGVVIRTKNGRRLVVSIETIRRSFVTELDAAWLLPLENIEEHVGCSPCYA
ncbi:MAG TPA: UpxY family transcription antiterminator [Candidatus Angelobacter sp.]|jgi:transcription antitermination factor NusG